MYDDERDEYEPDHETSPRLPEPYMPGSVTDQTPPDEEDDEEDDEE